MQVSVKPVFSGEQRAALQEAYDGGLKTKCAKGTTERKQLADAIGVSENQVKNFIGNAQRKQSGRKYDRGHSLLRPTGFTEFTHEISQKNPGTGWNPKGWSDAWKSLPVTEQIKYKKQAQETKMGTGSSTSLTEAERKKLSEKLLKQLNTTVSQLWDIGYQAVCLVVSPDQADHLTAVGRGRALSFLSTQSKFQHDLVKFCHEDKLDCTSVSAPALKQQVKEHLNNLYSTAIGKKASMPYSKIKSGDIVVEGLPSQVYPLKPPSHYGIEKLKTLLSCQKITVRKSSEMDEDDEGDEKRINSAITDQEKEGSDEEADTMDLDGMMVTDQEKEGSDEEAVTMDLEVKEDVKVNNMEQDEPVLFEISNIEVGPECLDGLLEDGTIVISVETEKESAPKAVSVKKGKENRKAELVKKEKESRKGKFGKAKGHTHKDDMLYGVEEIIATKKINGKNFYQIKWENCTKTTWEPEENIIDKSLLESFTPHGP